MTNLEIKSFTKNVVAKYSDMVDENVEKIKRLNELENSISRIKHEMDTVRDEIFSNYDMFNLSVFPVGGNVILKEYYKRGFHSGIVKDCVKIVRAYFFDDTDRRIRNAECVSLSESFAYSYRGLRFDFCVDKFLLHITFISSLSSTRPNRYEVERRGDYVGEPPEIEHPYINLVMSDIVGSVTVGVDSLEHRAIAHMKPTRDFNVVKNFVSGIINGKYGCS